MIRRKFGKNAIYAASIMTAGILALVHPIMALAATGTVTSSNVKVRAEASTSSQQVSSLDSGDKVDIIDETTDSQGYVWYRIYVNGQEYGYVRSDLISKSGETKSTDAGTSNAAQPQTQVTAVAEQAATVTVASANVRSGAGTGYSTVGTVKNGDGVTVTGEANGTDNNKWYQIKFGDSGRTGFVRADLLQMGAPAPAQTDDPQAEGEMAPTEGEQPAEAATGEEGAPAEGEAPAEEQPAEQPAVDPTVVGNGEFSLAYKDDGTGTETWYLYDNVQSTQVKLNDLLDYAKTGQQAAALEGQIKKLRGALIGMAIVIALLVLAILILVYKLRDYMYYEDDEEETSTRKNKYEELPAQKPARKFFERDKDADEPKKSAGRVVADSRKPAASAPVRKSAPIGSAASLLQEDRPARRAGTVDSRSERPAPSRDRSEERRQVTPQPQAPTGRKSRNFLIDDEDFEFEFLDLDDDDK